MRIAKVSRTQLRLIWDTTESWKLRSPPALWALAPWLVVARRLPAARPEEVHRFIHLSTAHCITNPACIHICVRGGVSPRASLWPCLHNLTFPPRRVQRGRSELTAAADQTLVTLDMFKNERLPQKLSPEETSILFNLVYYYSRLLSSQFPGLCWDR